MKTQQTIDVILDGITWEPVPPPDDTSDGLPYPTHEGILRIGECELQAYVLNTGQRIFTEESIVRFFSGDKK